ncbi:beta-ketoacyl synthase N-terminal-like domain-containing protein [Glaciimonas sp. PAMC28666]|uniref:beta-ketoacyl synthase N-terminal-like domain-containing protein n=1 Tax=Glaciimonas sp. PAMC28666 TaxID=2807626 RepID=UPI0019639CDF|nr:beta-ketoacyl synthase N-terminal-like domain-containing protein [Glaciimonas sp. PAMC28666]QRX83015.1 beta-ketoacyl-[acyl-carrier-protein] synthase II [Glaciimonas sp. PAMC28666]
MFYLNDLGLICALGDTHAAIRQRLFAGQSGVVMTDRYSSSGAVPVGCVDSALPQMESGVYPLAHRSRNNQLLLAALKQIRPAVDAAIGLYGPHRIAIVLGTSTSGIAESEAAFQFAYGRATNGRSANGRAANGRAANEQAIDQDRIDKKFPASFTYSQQEMGSAAAMLAEVLGVTGPAYVHSSACASSAKAMASAARLIQMGLSDVVLTGGVDSLCAFTIAGFSALASVSKTRCTPFSANRDGINIGEGAALFLMSAKPATVALRGWGESSDGYHISAPDPEGGGARIAIAQALRRANVDATQIDYINLHGTATQQNDAMESRVVHDLFGDRVAASSTKAYTGHALGAAGAIEAGLCWLAMQDDNRTGYLPPHLWDGVKDSNLPALNLLPEGYRLGRPLRWALSNSFAFGGANAALVMGRE